MSDFDHEEYLRGLIWELAVGALVLAVFVAVLGILVTAAVYCYLCQVRC